MQTIGIYDNKDIIRKSCAVLQNKFIDIVQLIDGGTMPILTSDTTMDYCYDIHLEEEDYTIGKVLEYILYRTHFLSHKFYNSFFLEAC